ncbi:MAG TPA: STAS domain-containing protein [Acidimicrobiales bacterium]|nr:STAS domain-containing protein [Acidimicrobiales bacterium]
MTMQDVSNSPVHVVRPIGDLDAVRAAAARSEFAAIADGRRVALDLSAVPFIDSCGLGMLLAGVRRIREAGGDVVVVDPRPAVHRVLHTCGLERVVPILCGVDSAAILAHFDAVDATGRDA